MVEFGGSVFWICEIDYNLIITQQITNTLYANYYKIDTQSTTYNNMDSIVFVFHLIILNNFTFLMQLILSNIILIMNFDIILYHLLFPQIDKIL